MGELLTGDVDAAYMCLLTVSDLLVEAEAQINERMVNLIENKKTGKELINLSHVNARILIMSEDMDGLLDRFSGGLA